MNRLRCGIIGTGRDGGRIVGALRDQDRFVIEAVGGRNVERSKKAALDCEANFYDDYRSLIVQEKLDVLFLCLPVFLCKEMIYLAAEQGIHVFQGSGPVGRSLPEAVECVERMEKVGLRYGIGNFRRLAGGYVQSHQFLRAGVIGEIYLVRGERFLYFPSEGGGFDWRGDPVLAGGGVLLGEGYWLVDQMNWNLGVPEQVYCVQGDRCSKCVQPPYRTEDTAVVSVQYSQGRIGNLVCGWMAGPEQERMVYYGTKGVIQSGPGLFRHTDPAGQVLEEKVYKIDEESLVFEELCRFADSIEDAEVKGASMGREHLANVAVIESAYLSGRTGHAENLKVYGSVFSFEEKAKAD